MNKKYLLALIILIIVLVGIFLHKKTNESLPISAQVTMPSGQEIQLRVANTNKTRELGLSYFKSLPQDQGMLFLFDNPGIYPFWMKGMNFPLDIIWLKRGQGGDYRVVYVAKNVLPSSYPDSVNPKIEADAVLEINSNLSTVYNLDLEKKLWISSKK
jgi:uncharacterized membrane protein (UPF0127 family)